MSIWNRIDLDVEPRPVFLRPGDQCYYAREYISEGGWQASQANQLISNFKKDPSKRHTYQWPHKQRAARQFAEELAGFIPEGSSIMVIPTSKPDDHPEYDPRFDMMIGTLHDLRPDLSMEKPVYRTEACQSLHTGGQRSVEQALRTLGWRGFDGEAPDGIILIDDVITCGTNYKACQRLLRQHCPGIEVCGAFWARTVWLADDEPEWDRDPDDE